MTNDKVLPLGMTPDPKINLTIVLLVRDTPHYLDRWLRWALRSKARCKILVADGSKDDACRLVSARFLTSDLNLEHLQFAPDSSREIYYNKIVSALAAVKTPFVSVMADDDLPWFPGLNLAAAALEKMPLASSARGRVHDFECQPDPLAIQSDQVLWRFYIPDSDLSSPDPSNRLSKHFSEYCLTYHDVTRIEVSRKIFDQQLSEMILDPNLNELFLSALLVAQGPIIRLDFPYLFRASRPNSSGTVIARTLDTFDEIFQPGWVDQYGKILGKLECMLPQRADGVPWKKFLHQCFRRFYAPLIIRALKNDTGHSRFKVAYSGSVSPHDPSTTSPDSAHNLARLTMESFLRGSASPQHKMSIGVLLTNNNQGAFLPRAFQQLAEQTCAPDEIVAIDVNSDDHSQTMITQWVTRSDTHKLLLLERKAEEQEIIKAGLQRITSDFFSLQSARDSIPPDYIAQVTHLVQANSAAGFICASKLGSDSAATGIPAGCPLTEASRYFSSQETEILLRNNFLYAPGTIWNTAAYREAGELDWRLRWLSDSHLADVIALRRGFCCVAEPLMETGSQPAPPVAGNDTLRQDEALLASARDWCSPAKHELFKACVRSGFFGLRDNPIARMNAVLNGSWSDHGKPLLLIYQGLLAAIDRLFAKAGLTPQTTPRKELLALGQIIQSYSDEYNEQSTIKTLAPLILPFIHETELGDAFIGFYSSYLIRTGLTQDAQDLLRKRTKPGTLCKAVLRARAEHAARTASNPVADNVWRSAIHARPNDVWFGMEYVRTLIRTGRTEAALEMAALLLQRDGQADVQKELQSMLPTCDLTELRAIDLPEIAHAGA